METTDASTTAEEVIKLYSELSDEEKNKVRRYLDRTTPGYRFTAEDYNDMVDRLEKGSLDVTATKKQHFVKYTLNQIPCYPKIITNR